MSGKNKKIITCKNCGNEFTGKYCNECSQQADTHRISWHELIHHLPHALWHVDGGLLFTMKEMLLRPGHTMRDYINGKRVKHFNPFLFVLLSGSLFVYLFSAGNLKLINKQLRLEDFETYNSVLAHKYYMIPFVFFLVMFSLTDRLLYRKQKFIFPELFIFNTYCAGEVFVLIICCVPFLYLQKYIQVHYDTLIIMRPIIKFALVAYLIRARFQLFGKKGDFFGGVKIIAQVLAVFGLYELFFRYLADFLSKQ